MRKDARRKKPKGSELLVWIGGGNNTDPCVSVTPYIDGWPDQSRYVTFTMRHEKIVILLPKHVRVTEKAVEGVGRFFTIEREKRKKK